MGIIRRDNSLLEVVKYQPLRCDTHFKYNMMLARDFFFDHKIEWVSLGSVLRNIRNGMNVGTEYYSMEETAYHYISVSQIKEYGLIKKNQNYLMESVGDLPGYFEIKDNMLLVTRSGTVGVAISSSHPSFDLEENNYIASGFVITAEMQEGFSADIVANYINMFPVQRYLTAMSAGACQKNISQTVIINLPIPAVLFEPGGRFRDIFAEYEESSGKILKEIETNEQKLEQLKKSMSARMTLEIQKNAETTGP